MVRIFQICSCLILETFNFFIKAIVKNNVTEFIQLALDSKVSVFKSNAILYEAFISIAEGKKIIRVYFFSHENIFCT